jgi:hypothetical protein
MRNAGTLEAGFRAGHQEAALFDTPLELVGIDQALPAAGGLLEPSESRGLGEPRPRKAPSVREAARLAIVLPRREDSTISADGIITLDDVKG